MLVILLFIGVAVGLAFRHIDSQKEAQLKTVANRRKTVSNTPALPKKGAASQAYEIPVAGGLDNVILTNPAYSPKYPLPTRDAPAMRDSPKAAPRRATIQSGGKSSFKRNDSLTKGADLSDFDAYGEMDHSAVSTMPHPAARLVFLLSLRMVVGDQL